MAMSKIEWTELTWNPVTGCTKMGPGCKHCYAERLAIRLQAMGQPHYADGFKVRCHPDSLDIPLHWKKPRVVFVNSMSDIFHVEVPLSYIRKIFAVICKASRHTFQVLTKRADRMAELAGKLEWPDNLWMGVTLENADYMDRIDCLRTVPAVIRFLSLEPLLSAIPDINLDGIDWCIVGGESGPGARPMKEKWVLDIKKQCDITGTAFFFKQWGGVNKKKAGRTLQGRTWDAMPELVTPFSD